MDAPSTTRAAMSEYIVLAPGSQLTYVGIGGESVPSMQLASCKLPLSPALTFASSLRVALSRHAALRGALSSYALLVAEPVILPAAQRRELIHAALSLLQLREISFLPARLCVATACGVASDVPVLCVDVGWECTRVFTATRLEIVAVGVRDVNEAFRNALGDLARACAQEVDDVRTRVCAFDRGSGEIGDARVDSLQLVVPGAVRVAAAEVLFDANDGR